jgi:recombination protein RecT
MAKNELAIIKKDTVDVVENKIREFQKRGELSFPPNYSPENAMRAAWLKLQEITDKNNVPALQSCTRDSIANSLLTMVVYGLTPLKDQGYFIVYGKKLIWQNSYFGNVALWKRFTGSELDPVAVVVYADDEFEYDIVDGEYTITQHKQSLKNIDDNKIVAAYAILTFPDGTKKTTLMTIDQIHKAWAQGQTRGNSPAHKNFPAEMAKKTVINRACKIAIKSSDDSSLNLIKETMRANDDSITEAIVAAEIEENANQIEVDIVDDTEADYEVVEVEDKPAEQVVTEGPGY